MSNSSKFSGGEWYDFGLLSLCGIGILGSAKVTFDAIMAGASEAIFPAILFGEMFLGVQVPLIENPTWREAKWYPPTWLERVIEQTPLAFIFLLLGMGWEYTHTTDPRKLWMLGIIIALTVAILILCLRLVVRLSRYEEQARSQVDR